MKKDGETEVGISGTRDAGCDLNLLQALTEVGIYRQDSVLWTIVDREAPLAGVPAHRRELLELAREAVSEEVEEQSKVEQHEDILVEACFGGRDLVELYVKERDHALEYGLLSDAELLAKQAWWARGCNWTAPASGGEKKSWIERQRDRLDRKIKQHEAEYPDESFAACAFWILLFIAAIMCAIKGLDPPAGQLATRRAA